MKAKQKYRICSENGIPPASWRQPGSLHDDAGGATAERQADGHHGHAALGLGVGGTLFVALCTLHPPLGLSSSTALLQRHSLLEGERDNLASGIIKRVATSLRQKIGRGERKRHYSRENGSRTHMHCLVEELVSGGVVHWRPRLVRRGLRLGLRHRRRLGVSVCPHRHLQEQ